MKLKDILNAKEALSTMFNTRFPGTKVVKIKKFVDACEKELIAFSSIRDAKMKELDIEQDKVKVVDPKKLKEFEIYINEVIDADVDVKLDFELTEAELENISLSANELAALQRLKIIKE